MRPALLLALAACASAPLPQLKPAPDWAKAVPVVVEAPASMVNFNNWANPEVEKPRFKASFEEDLAALGFKILTRPAKQGELTVSLGPIEAQQASATVRREGEQVEQFQVAYDSLDWWSSFGGNTVQDLRHLAREFAQRFADSPRVAEAARLPGRAGAPEASSTGTQSRLQLRGKLAVLDLRNLTSDLTRDNAQYFTDVVRQAALRSQPSLEVMTRENLLVLLQSTGKKLDECEGECEVDTGRRIGADAVVSGEIQKLGSSYKLTLRLHDTHEGRLLASAIASGKSIDELDSAASKAAEELFR